MTRLDRFYEASPLAVQNLLCSLYGFKVNRQRRLRRYRHLRVMLAESPAWSPRQVEEYGNRRFREIVRWARAAIPFYRDFWDLHGVREESVRDLGDIAGLPLTDKRDMRSLFLQSPPGISHIRIQTSGSTGTPLTFRTDLEALNMYYALWDRYKGGLGIGPSSRKAVFGGKMVVPLDQKTPPYWRWNLASRQLYFSTQHLSPETVPCIVEALVAFGPEEIFSYPSALAFVAGHSGPVRIPSLKVVNTSAENLSDSQRKAIRRVFGCDVRQTYGLAEPVAFFDECEAGRLHHNFEFGHAEILDENGRESAEGEIVFTGYFNRVMPFIRYRSGDIVRRGTDPCPCGRGGLSLESVDGRMEDAVVTPAGRVVGRMSHIFKGDDLDVIESQFVQRKVDALEIVVAPGPSWDGRAEELIRDRLKERLGDGMNFTFRYVSRVPRTPGGKMRAVVSQLACDKRH